MLSYPIINILPADAYQLHLHNHARPTTAVQATKLPTTFLPACPCPLHPCPGLPPQFIGFMVGANTMLEYLLAGSTVAKGFASYFTVLIGKALHS